MAIKKDIKLESGILVNGAYCKVENITLSKTIINFNIRKYVDINLPFFDETHYSVRYVIDGKNPFAQAYEYLKTLNEFKDAEDV